MQRQILRIIVLLGFMSAPQLGVTADAAPAAATQVPNNPSTPSRVPHRMDEFSGELPEPSNDGPPMYQGGLGKRLGSGPRRCCHETKDGQMVCH